MFSYHVQVSLSFIPHDFYYHYLRYFYKSLNKLKAFVFFLIILRSNKF